MLGIAMLPVAHDRSGLGMPRGRYVVFTADRALVRSDRNKAWDVYRWDTTTGTLGVVSVTNGGASCTPPTGALGFPGSSNRGISADATVITFMSNCANLTGRRVAGDAWNLFVRDTRRHTTQALDVTPRGKLSNGAALVDGDGIPFGWALSADGRWIEMIAWDRTLVGEPPPTSRPDPTEAYVRGPLR
jgi:Tol biopolymer transport system component